MPSSLHRHSSSLWHGFQRVFSEFSGISVQVFDAAGRPVEPAPTLPPLCVFLQRYPETNATCLKDCYRKASVCRDGRRTLTARCYAGLSYRVVPLRRRNRPQGVVIVGRVLNEVFGVDQCQKFIERYGLPRAAFLESMAAVRSLSGTDLDRAAAFVRRLAFSFSAADSRLEHRSALVRRQQALLSLAREAAAFTERGQGNTRAMLESLAGALSLPAVSLLSCGDGESPASVLAAAGRDEAAVRTLTHLDWTRVCNLLGRNARVYIPDRAELLKAGVEGVAAPLAALRLADGPRTIGYLVAAGASLGARQLDDLATASSFIAARLVLNACRERAESREEEARIVGQLAEKFLSARSLEELLPLALESAMQSLRARRGSILLAEGQGQITARALRGDHAPISGTIDTLLPGSVSHEVFFKRRPLLVQDTGREPGLQRERQFPYASRSFVSVPLRENGHALGVLHVTEREGEEVFTPRDLSLLERLSHQASGAIRKVKLEAEVQVLRLNSSTDHLTGVHNRRHLEEQLALEFQRARRYGQPLAVAMFDIDGFKALNDELGHGGGDRILRELAGIMRQQLRAVDILARFGGDEFVVVLPGTNPAGALATVEKIRKRIASVEIKEGPPSSPPLSLTVSAGLATLSATTGAAEDLLRGADQALLTVKKSGKNAALLWSD